MYTINRDYLTSVNKNTANRTKGDIRFIVIHYVGAEGTAKANAQYFRSVNRGVSAHYFVPHAGSNVIYQSVEDKDVAWHSGNRNTNWASIGIELCCRQKNGMWYFDDETVDIAVELVRALSAKYDVPIENIIRHYDVTGKVCPAPFVDLTSKEVSPAWLAFKRRIAETTDAPVLSAVTTGPMSPGDVAAVVKFIEDKGVKAMVAPVKNVDLQKTS
jgi:N-acetylmuramoyl-L-alanine amidase CwlA